MDSCGWTEAASPTQWTTRIQTVDATPTTFLSMAIDDNTTSTIHFYITAQSPGVGVDVGSFERRFRVSRKGGGPAVLGLVQTMGVDDVVGPISILVDTDGANAARVRVTGDPASPVDWIAFATWQALV
jgi:hypothetical protein